VFSVLSYFSILSVIKVFMIVMITEGTEFIPVMLWVYNETVSYIISYHVSRNQALTLRPSQLIRVVSQLLSLHSRSPVIVIHQPV